jgi:hypothetical protein
MVSAGVKGGNILSKRRETPPYIPEYITLQVNIILWAGKGPVEGSCEHGN